MTELLTSASRPLGRRAEPFVCHASRRLDEGEATHGEKWRSQSVAELLAELREEAADIGGWGALTLERLKDAGLSEPQTAAIHAAVLAAIGHGARAHMELRAASELLIDESLGRSLAFLPQQSKRRRPKRHGE